MNISPTSNSVKLLQLAVVGLAIATFLGFCADWMWFFFYADQPRVHYVVLAICLSVCAVILRRYRMALLGGLIIAVNLTVILSAYVGTRPRLSLESPTVSVLHANLGRSETLATEIEQAIERFSPTILLFQEVTPPFLEATEPKLRNYGLLVAEARIDSRGVAAFIRNDWQARVTGKIVRLARQVTDRPTVELNIDSRWRILSFHSKRPSDAQGYQIQAAEYRDLGQWLIARSGTPSVAIGDFNATPWSTRVRSLFKRSPSIQNGGQATATWPSSAGILGVPIDIVLHTDGVSMSSSSVFYADRSDHRAVVAGFSLQRDTESSLDKKESTHE